MTEDRRPVIPVRQLSLQQTTSSRQQIVRHRSTDDEKSLAGGRGKIIGNGKPPASRPKVRMAWTEAQRKTDKQLEKVEVVAHQIPGRSRPNTGRYRPFSGNEKATILYSRQQLAERLRLAWKHRQENKANIDIFLAHSVREERSDSALSTFTTSSTPRQEKGISVFDDEENERNLDEKSTKDGECKLEIRVDDSFVVEELSDLSEAEIKLDSPNNQKKNSTNSNAKQKRACFRSGTNKAFLTIEKSEENQDNSPSTSITNTSSTNKSLISKTILKNDRNASIDKPEIPSRKTELNDTSEQKYFNDDLSEVPIKSIISKNLNTKITKDDFPRNERFRDVSTIENVPQESSSHSLNVPPKIPQDHKNNSQTDKLRMTKVNQTFKNNQCSKAITPRRNLQMSQNIDRRSRRTNSAPPSRNLESTNNRVQVNIVIDTASTGKSLEKSSVNNCDNIHCQERETRIERFDSSLSKISVSRPTRSAPLKRRSKSTKRRLFSGLSKGEDDSNHSIKTNKTIDLVTMVSLVSSADSDSDIENSPRDDNLINELRSKLPTTPIIKASINSVRLRRVIKSVSFQNDSFDEEIPDVSEMPKEEKRNNQTRFGVASEKPVIPQLSSDTMITVPKETMILPSLLLGNDVDCSDVQLTDREKRCLAVPIGDLNDKKRKLLKTRSMPSRPILERQAISVDLKAQDVLNTRIRPSTPLLPGKTTLENFSTEIERPVITQKESVDEIPLEMCEPHFQTPKEKECWQLYRKMCDKGVCVSFDTVLRGMLTPTEYRLRQRELQNF